MILKINEPIVSSMESLEVEYTMEQLHYEVIKEMVISNYRDQRNPNNHKILTESVTSVIDRIADYFKELCKKVKEFFSKVMLYINAHTQELDKFCSQYKDKLSKLSPDFTVNGYKFNIDESVPVMNEFEKVIADYNNCLTDIGNMKVQDVKDEHSKFVKVDNINALRGKILGTGSPIDEDDFNSKVLETFRGSEDTIEIQVDSSYINNIVSTAKTLVGLKNKCEKDKVAFTSMLDKTQSFFDKKVNVVFKDLKDKEIRADRLSVDNNKMSISGTDNINHSDEAVKVLKAIMEFKYTQAKTLSGIINTVMLERLNAYKMNIKQNSDILRRSLFQKTDGGND